MESQIQIKTLEQASLVDQLNKYVVQLKEARNELYKESQVKEKMISIILHDVRSPLRFLNKITNHLNRNHRSLTLDDIGETLSTMSASTNEMSNFTENFLNWIQGKKEKFNPRVEMVDIASLLYDISEFYLDITELKGNKLVILVEDSPAMRSNSNLLRVIIRNLVDSSNNNTTNGTIHVTFTRNQNEDIFEVADNGRKINNREIERIYLPVAESPMGLDINEFATYFAFSIIRDFCDQLSGNLIIDNSRETGTSTKIIFRRTIDNQHAAK